MLKIILFALMPSLFLFSSGADSLLTGSNEKIPRSNTGTLERMIVASGSVAMDLDLGRLNRGGLSAKRIKQSTLRFDVERDSFFSISVFNGELRGPIPGTMALSPKGAAPAALVDSFQNLVLENTLGSDTYELIIRDGKSGSILFNIEGQEYLYDEHERVFAASGGRLLLSKDFAAQLGRPADTGAIVGQISIKANMRAVEVTEIVDGQVVADVMPALNDNAAAVPGPDVIVGDLIGLVQFGASGSQVGLAIGTTSCNAGAVDLNWFANPANDHPVIPQNLYRMSGGPQNNERFEQIGQSQVKHAFTALTENICGFGCNNVGGSKLGSGCSDPYSASLNAGPNLGSRAWINPFTGAYPRNDSATPNNNHTGHTHTSTSHRVLTEVNDLTPSLNPGATYYAEGQYVTPHEYAHCTANPGQCNMYNNVSYRRYNVSGTGSPFSFSPVGATVRTQPALAAWTGATLVPIEPQRGVDGVGTIAYKVTNPSPGVWHYEYAIYNQNIDRAIQSFSIPLGGAVTLNNLGFHAPPQHPGSSADGTVGSAGYSSLPWAAVQTGGNVTWSSETLAQNPNANAIRWGTMYNFRFDSNQPPVDKDAVIGFFKTGAPVTVTVQAPSSPSVSLSGRVMTGAGMGIRSARVIISGPGGTRSMLTGTFGYYSFDNLTAGGTYTVSVESARYTFAPLTMPVNDNATNVNFVPLP